MSIQWPLRPDGSEVPTHRRSWWAFDYGYPIFCASDWSKSINDAGEIVGRWMCGYCEQFSTDLLSPTQGQTLAMFTNCDWHNRISLD